MLLFIVGDWTSFWCLTEILAGLSVVRMGVNQVISVLLLLTYSWTIFCAKCPDENYFMNNVAAQPVTIKWDVLHSLLSSYHHNYYHYSTFIVSTSWIYQSSVRINAMTTKSRYVTTTSLPPTLTSTWSTPPTQRFTSSSTVATLPRSTLKCPMRRMWRWYWRWTILLAAT